MITAAFPHDANHTPITPLGLLTKDSQTLTANNTTANVPIFTITGDVYILSLYGIVTTDLGANNTAAYWRINDGSAQANISLNTGTTLSGAKAGSLIVRDSVATVALALKNASAAGVQDPVAATAPSLFMPFALVQKTGNVTSQIEFVYSTTDTPTSGAIDFYAGWIPLTPDSNLVAV